MSFLEVLKTEKPIELININTSKIPTFVLKLWKIVNDTELYRIISWNENGSSILVKQPHAMYKKVLPLYFKHSNLNSFIRQLNMYGFKKTTDIEKISTMNFNNVNVSEFSHKFFLRGRVDLLGNIRRKPSIKKSVHEPLIDSENNNSNFENNKLFNETQNMRSMQSGTENFIDQLTLQNESLKKEIAILHTRHRMQQNAIRKLCDVISEFGYQQPKSKVAISSEPFPTAKNNVTSSNYVDFDYVNMVTKSFNVIP